MDASRLKRIRQEERKRNRSVPAKFRKVMAVLCAVILSAAFLMFSVDLVRAKQKKLPPMFCISVMEYPNGSEDYYGLFYKVWKDHDPFENETKYYVGFWFIPKNFSI